MFEMAERAWAFFHPPDPPFSEVFGESADPEKVRQHMRAISNWRMKVSVTLLALVFGVIIAAFTPWGFVRAGDADRKIQSVVDSSVDKKLADIKTEQAQMKADLGLLKAQGTTNTISLNEILKSTIASTICRHIVRRSKEPNAFERNIIRQDIDVEQGKYKLVAGEYYPESRCGGT